MGGVNDGNVCLTVLEAGRRRSGISRAVPSEAREAGLSLRSWWVAGVFGVLWLVELCLHLTRRSPASVSTFPSA